MILLSTLLLKSTLLLATAWLVNRALARSSADVRHWVWNLAFASLLFIAIVPATGARIAVPLLEARPVSSGPAPGETTSSEKVTSTSLTTARFPTTDPVPQAVLTADRERASLSLPPAASLRAPAGGTRLSMPLLLALVWAAGVVIAGARTAVGLAALARAGRRARPLTAPGLALARRCARRIGLARLPAIKLDDAIQVPLVWGVFRPQILLPTAAAHWSRERLGAILLHELAHLRRGDHLTTPLARLIAILYWMNPLARLAARCLYLEREQACDEMVLRRGAHRIRYARQLLASARSLTCREPRAALALGERSTLGRRIRTILHSNLDAPLLGRTPALLSAGMLALLLVPLAAGEITHRPASGTPCVQRYLTGLTDGSPAEQLHAAWALGEREDAAAVPALLDALGHADPKIRGMAAWALGEIKDRSALPALERALVSDADPYAREMILRAVGEHVDPGSISLFIATLGDPEPSIRCMAVESLGEFRRDAEAMAAVEHALTDPDPAVRLTAVEVLATEFRALHHPSFRETLHDVSPEVRSAAVRLFAEHGGPTAPGVLMGVLDDADAGVRLAAVQALGRLGDPSSVDALIAATRDGDPRVRARAIWALDEVNISAGRGR